MRKKGAVSEKKCPNCGKPLLVRYGMLRCHACCSYGPVEEEEVPKVQVWENQPNDDHTWAFYYFLKDQGHDVTVLRNQGKVTLVVAKDE